MGWFLTGDGSYYNCVDVEVKPSSIPDESSFESILGESLGEKAWGKVGLASSVLLVLSAFACAFWRFRRCSCINIMQDQTQQATANSKTAVPNQKHAYKQISFRKPTWCQQCQRFMWGFANQGYECLQCHITVCKDCSAKTNSSECRCPALGIVVWTKRITQFHLTPTSHQKLLSKV